MDFKEKENRVSSVWTNYQLSALHPSTNQQVLGSAIGFQSRGRPYILTAASNVVEIIHKEGQVEKNFFTDLTVYEARTGPNIYASCAKISTVVVHPRYDGIP